MSLVILSEEHEEILFLRFSENDKNNLEKLNENLAKIARFPLRFILVDFGALDGISDEIFKRIIDFTEGFSPKFYGKICFVATNKNLIEKIKLLGLGEFFKNFRFIGDAINYFYWETDKIRECVSMKMPSDISFVPSVRACLREFCAESGVDGREAFELELILDELCNNAIEHGAQGINKTVEVFCAVGQEFIEINVSNGYSARVLKGKIGHDIEKDMEKWALFPNKRDDIYRGRGLGLVRKFSENYEINSSEDGTWVHVIKRKTNKEE